MPVVEVAAIPKRGRGWPLASSIERRPLRACLMAGLLVVVLRLLLLPVYPIPEPVVHDEFSYLTGADTFASGRLTNPTHSMWLHFETFHVNQLPTYCSKYPPGQALFLAFGQKFLGHPWFGVVLSMGLLVAALCWMLQQWVTAPLALLTTGLVILQWGLSGYWMNSYWGGAVAGIGGALVLGAIPRLVHRPDSGIAAVAAVGVSVLANSRPLEGALTTIGALTVLLSWRRREGKPLRSLLGNRVVLPVTAVLLPVAAAMMYYNFRTTGSGLQFPYAVNQAAYAASPHFYFLAPMNAPAYNHEEIRRLWMDWDLRLYEKARANPLDTIKNNTEELHDFYTPGALLLLFLVALIFGRQRKIFYLALVIAFPLAAMVFAKAVRAHYLAAVFPAFVALLGLGLQTCLTLKRRWAGYRLGALAAAILVGLIVRHSMQRLVVKIVQEQYTRGQGVRRSDHIKRLEAQPGRDLVVVRYSPTHEIDCEWVYNRADIDGAEVVWARDIRSEDNRGLFEYFHDRNIWLFEPDTDPLRMTPYPR